MSQSTGPASSNPAYLPEIDGLRAVAVLGVILNFMAEESLRRSQHFLPQTSQQVSREAALATWIEQVGHLAELHPKNRFVLFSPTPEIGSGVPMETCRPQWFRPVLSSDCQGVEHQGLDRFDAYLSKQLAGVLASSPNVVLYNPADAL